MNREFFCTILFVLAFSTISPASGKNQALSMDYYYSPVVMQATRILSPALISPFAPTVSLIDAEAFIAPSKSSESVTTIADPLVKVMFFLYSNIYGRVKGDSCLFYPTCSHFSRLAVRDHGLVNGIWMTGGRLIRAHLNFDHYYPIMEAPEGVRWFNPPAHECFKFYRNEVRKLTPVFHLKTPEQDTNHHENH